jgi:hypothetical protein
MSVEIRTEAAQALFWEYMNGIPVAMQFRPAETIAEMLVYRPLLVLPLTSVTVLFFLSWSFLSGKVTHLAFLLFSVDL